MTLKQREARKKRILKLSKDDMVKIITKTLDEDTNCFALHSKCPYYSEIHRAFKVDMYCIMCKKIGVKGH